MATSLIPPRGCEPKGVTVNDVHSRLNPTVVRQVVQVRCHDEALAAVEWALETGRAISVAGGRHAMGGQQFGGGTVHLDTRGLNRVLDFDSGAGLICVEAGILWPDLICAYLAMQGGNARWGIAQKQTGADRLSVGGAVSANAHGRGLTLRPLVADVEAVDLIDAGGRAITVSRTRDAELFRLVIGGYGLFGVITAVTLRLAPRTKLERVVAMTSTANLAAAFESRIAEGFQYGDFQFAIDERSDDFLRRGVFSCYRPVDPATPMEPAQRELAPQDWRDLIYLAHANKSEAFRRYAEHYLATSGQVYWSDTHQLGVYLDDYHLELDRRLRARCAGSEVITELYVPRSTLASFLDEAREDFLRHGVNLIYGTVRLIEKDEETFLAWARERYACIVLNLHTDHTTPGLCHSRDAFRRLIDMAARRGGSYFLTYHRHATRAQVEACHPRMRSFLERKRELDPQNVFESDWHRHHRKLMEGA